jgi:vancomycin aglycone glucosyltransferase
VAFLDTGTPPVYVGFGSMPMRAQKDIARVAIEAIRAQGRRALVGRGWADLALIDDRDDCLAAKLLLDAVSRERPPVSA